MISSWTIYGLIVLGNFGFLVGLTAVLLTFGLIIVSGYYIMETTSDYSNKDDLKIIKPIMKKLVAAVVVLWLLTALWPSTKEMAAIYLIPKIANNEHVQKIPDKALTVLNKYLDEWIKDQVFDKKEK